MHRIRLAAIHNTQNRAVRAESFIHSSQLWRAADTDIAPIVNLVTYIGQVSAKINTAIILAHVEYIIYK